MAIKHVSKGALVALAIPVALALSACGAAEASTPKPTATPSISVTPTTSPTTTKAPASTEAQNDFQGWALVSRGDARELAGILDDWHQAVTDADLVELHDLSNDIIDKVDEMKDHQPPSTGDYKELHTEYNAMLKEYRKAATLMRDGIEDRDSSKIGRVPEYIDKAGKHAKQVAAEGRDLS